MYIFFIHRVELYKFITEKFARSRAFVKRENRTCVGSVFLSVCLCLSMWRMPQVVLLNSHQRVAKRMDSSPPSESKPRPRIRGKRKAVEGSLRRRHRYAYKTVFQQSLQRGRTVLTATEKAANRFGRCRWSCADAFAGNVQGWGTWLCPSGYLPREEKIQHKFSRIASLAQSCNTQQGLLFSRKIGAQFSSTD